MAPSNNFTTPTCLLTQRRMIKTRGGVRPIVNNSKIIELLDNKKLRTEMGEFGYNRVINELSWDFESKKLINIYRKILKTK